MRFFAPQAGARKSENSTDEQQSHEIIINILGYLDANVFLLLPLFEVLQLLVLAMELQLAFKLERLYHEVCRNVC